MSIHIFNKLKERITNMTKKDFNERNKRELERIERELAEGTVDKDVLNLEYMLYSIDMGSELYSMGCIKTLRKAIELVKKAKGIV